VKTRPPTQKQVQAQTQTLETVANVEIIASRALPARALPLFRYTQPVRQGARDGCLRREATRRSLYAASAAAVAAQVCALSHSLLDDGA